MNLSQQKKENGFSIVEMIVAMSVFVVAISLAIGIFMQGLRSQRVVGDMITINSDTSLVFEQMMREMRAGVKFSLVTPKHSPCDAENVSDGITFERRRDGVTRQVTYGWDSAGGSILRKENDVGSTVNGFQSVTAVPNVKVKRLCFIMPHVDYSVDPTNMSPWRITISATVGPSNPQILTQDVNVETTVVSRILPIDIQ